MPGPTPAQTEAEIQRGGEHYREMLREDPWSNPGRLDADRGEMLRATTAGPNEVTLEDCDFGLGPGVVDGAFAQMPRYFEDAGRAMDAETRILWCMETLQGRDMTEFLVPPHPRRSRRARGAAAAEGPRSGPQPRHRAGPPGAFRADLPGGRDRA